MATVPETTFADTIIRNPEESSPNDEEALALAMRISQGALRDTQKDSDASQQKDIDTSQQKDTDGTPQKDSDATPQKDNDDSQQNDSQQNDNDSPRDTQKDNAGTPQKDQDGISQTGVAHPLTELTEEMSQSAQTEEMSQSAQRSDGPVASHPTAWNCEACTFANNAARTICEICGTAKPREAASSNATSQTCSSYGECYFYTASNGNDYAIDLKRMVQRNVEHSTERIVRRLDGVYSWQDERQNWNVYPDELQEGLEKLRIDRGPASTYASSAAALTGRAETKWSCSMCTFMNNGDRTRCGICDTARVITYAPAASRQPSSTTPTNNTSPRASTPPREGPGDDNWNARDLKVGDYLDALDGTTWRSAVVLAADSQRERVFIHFVGWGNNYDQWMPFGSKLAPQGSHVAFGKYTGRGSIADDAIVKVDGKPLYAVPGLVPCQTCTYRNPREMEKCIMCHPIEPSKLKWGGLSSQEIKWRETIRRGSFCLCLDSERDWLLAQVIEVKTNQWKIHYVQYTSRWDEWVSVDSRKLRPIRPMYEFTAGNGNRYAIDTTYMVQRNVMSGNTQKIRQNSRNQYLRQDEHGQWTKLDDAVQEGIVAMALRHRTEFTHFPPTPYYSKDLHNYCANPECARLRERTFVKNLSRCVQCSRPVLLARRLTDAPIIYHVLTVSSGSTQLRAAPEYPGTRIDASVGPNTMLRGVELKSVTSEDGKNTVAMLRLEDGGWLHDFMAPDQFGFYLQGIETVRQEEPEAQPSVEKTGGGSGGDLDLAHANAKPTAPSSVLVLDAKLSQSNSVRAADCPGHHGLVSSTSGDDAICDVCDSHTAASAVLLTCHICNFHVCNACVHGPTPARGGDTKLQQQHQQHTSDAKAEQDSKEGELKVITREVNEGDVVSIRSHSELTAIFDDDSSTWSTSFGSTVGWNFHWRLNFASQRGVITRVDNVRESSDWAFRVQFKDGRAAWFCAEMCTNWIRNPSPPPRPSYVRPTHWESPYAALAAASSAAAPTPDLDNMSYQELVDWEASRGVVKSKAADVLNISVLPTTRYKSPTKTSKSTKTPAKAPMKTPEVLQEKNLTEDRSSATKQSEENSVASEEKALETWESVTSGGGGADPPQEARAEEEEQFQCVVCQEYFEEDEMLKTMPCFHRFHADCLDHWLAIKDSCPVCQSSCVAD